MKTIYLILIASALIFISCPAKAAEWVRISTNNGDDISYDRQSLKKPRNGMIRAWCRIIPTDKKRQRYIQTRQKADSTVNYDNLSYWLDLWEANCSKSEFRLLAIIEYDGDGKVLNSATYRHSPAEDWEPVIPASVGEEIFNALCQVQKKK